MNYGEEVADLGLNSPKIPVFSLLNREYCGDGFA